MSEIATLNFFHVANKVDESGWRISYLGSIAVDIRTNHLCRYSRRDHSHKRSICVSSLLSEKRLG